MKKLFSVMLIFLMGLFLYSCDNNQNINITVNGCKDYTVDMANNRIDINVVESVDHFNLNDIVIPEGYTVTFFEDEKPEQVLESKLVKLNYGANFLGMEIVSKETVDYKLTFKICINRLVGVISRIEAENWKANYALNEKLPEDSAIRVIYADGHIDKVKITSEMIKGFDTSTIGNKKATVTYKEFSLDLYYKVSKSVTSIEFKTVKTKFFINDPFETIELLVKFDDGSETIRKITEDMLPEFSTILAGTKTIKINYEGKTLDYTYTVEKIAIVDVQFVTLQQEFVVGSKTPTGTIKIKYNNKDTYEEVLVKPENIFGFDAAKEGSFTAKIKHNGFEINYEYNVVPNIVEEIISVNLQNEYFINDKIADGTLTVRYTDNSEGEIHITPEMYSGFDTTSASTSKSITFRCGNGVKIFKYSVKANVVESINSINFDTNKYFVGDEISNGTIEVTYTNGEKKTLTITPEMYSGFDTKTAGEKVLTFNLGNATQTFNYTVEEIKVTSINSIKNFGPTFLIGDSFPSNATIVVVLNNNKTEELQITPDIYTGFDTTKEGSNTLVITKDGVRFECQYEVKNGVKSFVVDAKKEYYLNEVGIQGHIIVTYLDNTTEKVALNDSMTKGTFTTTTLGEKTITITYDGKTQEYTYLVREAKLIEIKVSSTDNLYFLNGEFKPCLLSLIYEDVSKNDSIELTLDMLTGFSTKEAGDFDATVTYNGLTCKYHYRVSNATLLSIEVDYTQTKDKYYEGDSFVNGKLNLVYDDASLNTQIDLTIDMLDKFENTLIGAQTSTVTFKGVSCTYKYQIEKVKVTNIELTDVKTTYEYKEVFTKGTILVSYNNGKTENVEINSINLIGFDTNTLGNHSAEIIYNDFAKQFNYTVIDVLLSIKIKTLNNTYALNEEFTNGVLELVYKTGKIEETAITLAMVSGFDTTTEGIKELTVHYGDFTATLKYNVYKRTLTNITTTNFPKEVVRGQKLENLNVTLGLEYNIGGNLTINLNDPKVTVTGFDTTNLGVITVTIVYEGVTVTAETTVIEKVVERILVNELKYNYYVAETFVPGTLKVIFNDGEEKIVALEETMVSGFDTKTPGTFTLTVTYEGKTTPYVYNVHRKAESIKVTADTRTEFFVDDRFVSGYIEVTYVDKFVETIKLTSEMIENFDTTTAGAKVSLVKFQDVTCEFKYNVTANVVTSIKVLDLENQTLVINQKVEDYTIEITYNNPDKNKKMLLSDLKLTVDVTKLGANTLTITYDNFTVEVPYNVVKKEMLSISVEEFNAIYVLNQEFIPGKLLVKYNDQTTEVITLTIDMFDKFDTTTVGAKQAVITYGNLSTNCSYEVKEIKELLIYSKPSYFEGDAYAGGELVVIYADGAQNNIPLTLDMITGFDTTVVGDKKEFTVSYLGKTAKFMYKVIKLEVVSIDAITYKEVYNVNESLGEVILKARYNSGMLEDVVATPEMITDFDSATIGIKNMLVTYKGQTLTLPYAVNDKLTGIKIVSYDHTVVMNSTFNNGVLELTYDSGYITNVPLTIDMVSGFDTNTFGRKTLTITYGGVSVNAELTVTEKAMELPKPEVINHDLVIKAVKRLWVIAMGYNNMTTEEIDAISTELIEFDITTKFFEEAFTAANFSNTQLEQLIAVYDEHQLQSLLDFSSGESVLSLLTTKENYDTCIKVLAEVKTIFSKAQLVAFFNSIFYNANFADIISDLERGLIENKGTDKEIELKAELDRIKGLQESFNKRDLLLALVDLGYDLFDVLAVTSHKEVMTVMGLFMNQYTPNSTEQELYNVVKVVRNLLTRIIDMGYSNYGSLILENVFSLFGMTPGTQIVEYKLITFALDNLELINKVLNNITLESVKRIKFLLFFNFAELPQEDNGDLYLSLKETFRIVDPLLDALNNNSELKVEVISYFCNISGMDYKCFENVLNTALELSTLEIDTITYKQYHKLITDALNIRPSQGLTLMLNDSDIILFKKGTTVNDAYDLMVKYSQLAIVGADGNNLQIACDNIHLDDVNTVGWHTGYVRYGYNKFYFMYYIYESVNDFNITYVDGSVHLTSNNSYVYYKYWNHENYSFITIKDDILTYDRYITLTKKFIVDDNSYFNNKESLSLDNLVISDSKPFYHNRIEDNGFYENVDINLDKAIALGLDKNNTKLQYINYTASNNKEYKLPIIYIPNFNSEILARIEIKDLEYKVALCYVTLPKKNNVDMTKFEFNLNGQVLTYEEYINELNKYFDGKIELRVYSDSVYIIYGNYRIHVAGIHGYASLEDYNIYHGVNSLKDVTLDYLKQNVVLTYNDTKLDNTKLFDYIISLGGTFEKQPFANKYFRLELGDLFLGYYYIKDNSNMLVSIVDSLGNKENNVVTTPNLTDDDQIFNEFLKQQTATIYRTSKVITYTGQDYIDKHFNLNYSKISFRYLREGSNIINGKLEFYKVYEFVYRKNNENWDHSTEVVYSKTYEIKPKVNCIEIPKSLNEREQKEYLVSNFQNYFIDDLNLFSTTISRDYYFNIKLDNVTNNVSFILLNERQQMTQTFTLPYKYVDKVMYIWQTNVHHGDKGYSIGYPNIYFDDFNSDYISKNYNKWFNVYGYTGNPTVTLLTNTSDHYIHDLRSAKIEFNDEFSFIHNFYLEQYEEVSHSITINNDQFNIDYLYNNSNLFVKYNKIDLTLSIRLDTDCLYYQLNDNYGKPVTWGERRIDVYFNELFVIAKDKYYEQKGLEIYSLDLNEQYLKENVNNWFDCLYNGSYIYIKKPSDFLVSVSYDDTNITFNFGSYGTFDYKYNVKYHIELWRQQYVTYQQITMENANTFIESAFKFDSRYASYKIDSVKENGYYTDIDVTFTISVGSTVKYEYQKIVYFFTDRVDIKQVKQEVTYTEPEIDYWVMRHKIDEIFTCYGYKANYMLGNYLYGSECNATATLNGDIVTYDFGQYGIYTVKFVKATQTA